MEEEEKVINLKVKKSSISGAGIVRMNEKDLKEIDVEEGDLGVVFTEEKAEPIKIFADKMIEQGYISLRKDDIESLGIEEGDEVGVTEYHKASEMIKEKLGDIKEKIVGFFKKEDEEEEQRR